MHGLGGTILLREDAGHDVSAGGSAAGLLWVSSLEVEFLVSLGLETVRLGSNRQDARFSGSL